MASPIEQFTIKNIMPLGKIGGAEIAVTNSALFMVAAAATIVGFLVFSTRTRAVVPGRMQSLAEMSYEFIASTIRSTAGNEGMRFFPLVFSLFSFILILNLLGMLPGGFTVTSHIVVTFTLAMIVFLTLIVVGLALHGTHFFKLFVPSGVPGYILPLVVAIEVISFLSRPISLSVRLFANMLAGHIALKIFAGFVGGLLGAGVWAIIAPLPLFLTVALTALEFLVAFLQAYVFTILTCIYLNDALHPGH